MGANMLFGCPQSEEMEAVMFTSISMVELKRSCHKSDEFRGICELDRVFADDANEMLRSEHWLMGGLWRRRIAAGRPMR